MAKRASSASFGVMSSGDWRAPQLFQSANTARTCATAPAPSMTSQSWGHAAVAVGYTYQSVLIGSPDRCRSTRQPRRARMSRRAPIPQPAGPRRARTRCRQAIHLSVSPSDSPCSLRSRADAENCSDLDAHSEGKRGHALSPAPREDDVSRRGRCRGWPEVGCRWRGAPRQPFRRRRGAPLPASG